MDPNVGIGGMPESDDEFPLADFVANAAAQNWRVGAIIMNGVSTTGISRIYRVYWETAII